MELSIKIKALFRTSKIIMPMRKRTAQSITMNFRKLIRKLSKC